MKMLTSRANLLISRGWRQYASFLKQFCKTNSNNSNGSDSIAAAIDLENPFKLYNLDTEPKSTVSLSQKTAVKLYSEMLTIRRMENACANLYKEKIIRGFCHLYVGQEACCVGIKSSMRPQDTIITSYRGHGFTYIVGISPYEIIAELCQKETGCSRGKGGSMHTYGPNFFGGNGIVASQAPLGVGVALTHAYRCDSGVTFICYGDGAANQGQLHEAFNMACLWKLPAIFVCENNKYGMGTSIKRSSCSTDYYTRGDYIPGLWVDGNNVLAVRSAAEFVINYACSCGPIVMELETYRYLGHSMSDPGTSYRKREEVQMMREKNDPITRFREVCLKHNILKEEDFKKIDQEVKMDIDNAVKQARQDSEPNVSELATDVYAKNLESNIRNVLAYNLKHTNFGTPLVPAGVVKPTPKSEIKEVINEDKKEKEPSAKLDAKNVTGKSSNEKNVKGNKQEKESSAIEKSGKNRDPKTKK